MDKNQTPIGYDASAGLLRLVDVLRLIPISRTRWYAGVKAGIFPKPTKFHGGRAAFYKASDIMALIDSIGK